MSKITNIRSFLRSLFLDKKDLLLTIVVDDRSNQETLDLIYIWYEKFVEALLKQNQNTMIALTLLSGSSHSQFMIMNEYTRDLNFLLDMSFTKCEFTFSMENSIKHIKILSKPTSEKRSVCLFLTDQTIQAELIKDFAANYIKLEYVWFGKSDPQVNSDDLDTDLLLVFSDYFDLDPFFKIGYGGDQKKDVISLVNALPDRIFINFYRTFKVFPPSIRYRSEYESEFKYINAIPPANNVMIENLTPETNYIIEYKEIENFDWIPLKKAIFTPKYQLWEKDALSEDLLIQKKLDIVDFFQNLEFEEESKSEKLNLLLIGPNGSGKTSFINTLEAIFSQEFKINKDEPKPTESYSRNQIKNISDKLLIHDMFFPSDEIDDEVFNMALKHNLLPDSFKKGQELDKNIKPREDTNKIHAFLVFCELHCFECSFKEENCKKCDSNFKTIRKFRGKKFMACFIARPWLHYIPNQKRCLS